MAPRVKERSAGVVIIRETERECRFLLLRAYRHWDFPKGAVEPGEDPVDTARREVAEETGIEELTFPWGLSYYETEPYNRGRKVARYYVGQTTEKRVVLPVNEELGRPENHEYRWTTRREARALLNDRVRAALEWAADLAGCSDQGL